MSPTWRFLFQTMRRRGSGRRASCAEQETHRPHARGNSAALCASTGRNCGASRPGATDAGGHVCPDRRRRYQCPRSRRVEWIGGIADAVETPQPRKCTSASVDAPQRLPMRAEAPNRMLQMKHGRAFQTGFRSLMCAASVMRVRTFCNCDVFCFGLLLVHV
jgi:hypothetical protein